MGNKRVLEYDSLTFVRILAKASTTRLMKISFMNVVPKVYAPNWSERRVAHHDCTELAAICDHIYYIPLLVCFLIDHWIAVLDHGSAWC